MPSSRHCGCVAPVGSGRFAQTVWRAPCAQNTERQTTLSDTPTLQELIPGYPDEGPPTLLGLYFADYSELNEVQKALRKQAVELHQNAGEVRITSPVIALELLLPPKNKTQHVGQLKVVQDTWTTYVLDHDRKRVLRRTEHGWSYLKETSGIVPEAAELPPLPMNGTYLLLWGGSPEVLEIPGVCQRLRKLQHSVPVADVLFWNHQKGTTPTLYSLKTGCGDQGGTRVEFVHPDLVKEAQP